MAKPYCVKMANKEQLALGIFGSYGVSKKPNVDGRKQALSERSRSKVQQPRTTILNDDTTLAKSAKSTLTSLLSIPFALTAFCEFIQGTSAIEPVPGESITHTAFANADNKTLVQIVLKTVVDISLDSWTKSVEECNATSTHETSTKGWSDGYVSSECKGTTSTKYSGEKNIAEELIRCLFEALYNHACRQIQQETVYDEREIGIFLVGIAVAIAIAACCCAGFMLKKRYDDRQNESARTYLLAGQKKSANKNIQSQYYDPEQTNQSRSKSGCAVS